MELKINSGSLFEEFIEWIISFQRKGEGVDKKNITFLSTRCRARDDVLGFEFLITLITYMLCNVNFRKKG